METKTATVRSSRRRFWAAAWFIGLVAAGVALFLHGPFLNARLQLALRGIDSADYPGLLHTACARADTETLALLLDARVALNHRDGKGSTALHTAVRAGAGRAVEMLLEAGADQRLVDAEDYPPLSLALLRDDTSIARLLLEHRGSSLVPLGKDHQPAPFEAVATGNVNLLRLLLAHDLDANIADQHGVSLLAHAIRRADYNLIETLLQHGANANAAFAPDISYLAHAARAGDSKLAELLLDYGADMNATGRDGISPLALAVDEGRPDVTGLLLKRGAILPPARPGAPSLLQRAAEHDDVGTVRLLLAHGAEADGSLVPALRRGHTEILSELLAGGASVDSLIDDQPAIEWAVRNASPEVVGMLLDHGADPEILGREGQSMLALAVALDRPEVVAALADHGADIDRRVESPALDAFADLFGTRYARFYLTKDRGLTPLMLAVLRGRHDTVRVLLDRNARLDTPTAEHRTWPIGLAAYQKDVPMMQLLLGRDPDPGKQRRRILVSLADQTAALYVDGEVRLTTRVSTGRQGYETPPGKYVITNKHREWKSTLYDDAPMPYFLRLNAGAIGLHEGVVPRQPASHGCIRVPRGTARRLFASAEVGDPVTVVKGSLAIAEAAHFSSANEPTLD